MTHYRWLSSFTVFVFAPLIGACADAAGPAGPNPLLPVAEASVVLAPAAASSEWRDWPINFLSSCTGLVYSGSARIHLVEHTMVWGGTRTEVRERRNLGRGVVVDNHGTTYSFQEVVGGTQTVSSGTGVAEYNYVFQMEPRGGGGVERHLYWVRVTWNPVTLHLESSITAICR